MAYMTGREALDAHIRRLATKPSGVDYHRRAQLAKEWANSRGYLGRSGGWIYDGNRTIFQGYQSLWSMNKRAILDWLTAKLTAARTLHELAAETGPTYRPTILPRDWRYIALADAYDEYQWERQDSRRAWRGHSTT